MAIKKKGGGGGGANWMDTYGDMVTLLLCFFVLLYSMSTLDEQKWARVVQSLNPGAVTQEEPTGGYPDQSSTVESELTEEQVREQMEELYKAMQAYLASDGADKNVSVTKGDGYVFISFNDEILFDGESWTLRENSKPVLDKIGEILSAAAPAIDEVRVLGHTAQASPDHPNHPDTDRFLGSNRATVVLVYLQEHCEVDPARLLSVGYGQWRPVASNDTPEERAKNRRVEMVITGRGLSQNMEDSITQYYTDRQIAAPISPLDDVAPGESYDTGDAGT